MIKHLKHNQIDKVKWDNCIQSSENGLVYALSWYLDCVSPNWEALVLGDYEGVFPIPVKVRNGIRFVAQPVFTQQLGWFGDAIPKGVDIVKIIKKKYLFGFLSLNSGCPFKNSAKKSNLVLSLSPTYKEISANFSSNHKRNIKKAESNKFCLEIINPESFSKLFSDAGWQNKFDLKHSHRDLLQQLIETGDENGNGIVYAVKNVNNEIVAAAFCLLSDKRITYLFPVTNTEGYEGGAQFFLIDQLVKKYAQSSLLFDFEGSSIDGIRKFYLGFGAGDENYYFLQFYRNIIVKALLSNILK